MHYREYSPQELHAFNKFIASKESWGGKRDALNKVSGAYGPYQHLASTTKLISSRTGKDRGWLRNNPDGQDFAQNWLLKENLHELQRRGIEINPTNVYGIHQQGGGVLKAMLSGNLTPSQEKLIVSNTPGKYRTGNPAADWQKAYGGYSANNVPSKSGMPAPADQPVHTPVNSFTAFNNQLGGLIPQPQQIRPLNLPQQEQPIIMPTANTPSMAPVQGLQGMPGYDYSGAQYQAMPGLAMSNQVTIPTGLR